MRKLATAICLSALMASGAVQAQWEGNWLIGVSGGWAEREGNLYLSTFDTDVEELTVVGNNLEDSGWDWGILGGYQARCNGWLVGVELNVDWANRHNDNTYQYTDVDGDSFVVSADYKRDTNVGLTGRLGFQVAQFVLPYIRAGVETSRDRLSINAVTAGSSSMQAFAVSGSERVYRFVAGIGAEIPVPMVTGLSARAEYDYHSKGRSVDAQGFATDAVTFVNANTKQRVNSGIIALVYNFM